MLTKCTIGRTFFVGWKRQLALGGWPLFGGSWVPTRLWTRSQLSKFQLHKKRDAVILLRSEEEITHSRRRHGLSLMCDAVRAARARTCMQWCRVGVISYLSWVRGSIFTSQCTIREERRWDLYYESRRRRRAKYYTHNITIIRTRHMCISFATFELFSKLFFSSPPLALWPPVFISLLNTFS